MEANEGAPSVEQLQRLTGKVILDEEFLQSFLENPQQMAQQFDPDITLTEEQISVIGSLDKEEVKEYVEELVEEIGRVQVAFWLAPDLQGPGDLPIK